MVVLQCEATLTSMASKPQYSLASSSRGTSACSKRVVPHVFKMKRLLETNMLLSLPRDERKEKQKKWLDPINLVVKLWY